MTDTLTEVFCDRWFDTENTSSVIETVYYSSDEKKLFVELNSGVTAGYQNVPADIYTAMEALNTNRLNGDEAASVGRYWNQWIKPYMEGLDTADIEIVTQEDRYRHEKLVNLMREKKDDILFDDGCAECAAQEPVQAQDVFIAPLQAPVADDGVRIEPLYMFSVNFLSGDNEVNLAVKAHDVQEAADRFHQATEILGWDSVTIKSITQHFL